MKKIIVLLLSVIFFMGCFHNANEKIIFDTVIIGGGLMGSATAWQLSKQGNSILLLEKQDSLYTQGSSYGEARIARSSNRGNDMWSYLHNRSVLETQDLIQFLNTMNNTENKYSMEDIYTTKPVTYVGRVNIYDNLFASLKRQNIKYELAVNPDEGKSKLQVNLPDSVLLQREFNTYSGTMNPHTLITYLHQAVRNKGNSVKYKTQVIDISYNQEKDLFNINTQSVSTGESNIISARKVACAAGPYNGTLLQDIAPYFKDLINPKRVFLAFLKIRKETYEHLSPTQKKKIQSFYPVINSSEGTRQGSFFSMIEYYDKDNIPVIKIGGHFQRSDIKNLDEVWTQSLSQKEREWSINNTAEYFDLIDVPMNIDDLTITDSYSCVYSLTDSEVPFVTQIVGQDSLPNDRFVVLGGMSGVGAKGAMTYGLIASNLLNQKSEHDPMYRLAESELGFERLLNDLKD